MKYVVIGGVAAVIHGVPRITLDLDILIESTLGNAERLLSALAEAGFGTASMISADELLTYPIIVFKDRVRLDVFTYVPGLRFSTAWKNRESRRHEGQEFWIASKKDLLRAKRASGRDKDLEDIRALTIRPRCDT